MDKRSLIAAAAASLALAACGDTGNASEEAAAPAAAASAPAPEPAPQDEEVVRSETVEAVFTGWEMGDYVWANLEVEGREASGAWVGPAPLEHFLEAHKGKPLTVRIDTVKVDIPEAGGTEEIEKIAEARAGGVTAAVWWSGRTAEQKKAAEARVEEVLAGGG